MPVSAAIPRKGNATLSAEAQTAWDRACPKCGAKLQHAARRCWVCRTDFPAEEVDESDYRSTDADAELAGAASVLVAVGVSAVVVLIILFLCSIFLGGFMFWLW